MADRANRDYSERWPNSLEVVASSDRHHYLISRHSVDQSQLHDTAEAEVKERPLGQASLIDRIIFDCARAKKDNPRDVPIRFLVLSLWADHMEFNLIISVASSGVAERCIPLYVRLPKERITVDEKYWKEVFRSGRRGGEVVAKLKDCCRVIWNEFSVVACEATALSAKRVHIVAIDAVRSSLQTMPLLKDGLFQSREDAQVLGARSTPVDRFHRVYQTLLRRAEWISVVRGPTLRNLESLSSILSDKSRRVTLVSGFPGTGKEAFSKTIHHGDRTWKAEGLVESTGPALAAGDIAATLKAAINEKGGTASAVLIDEFNKGLVSEPRQMSQMLRVLEDSRGSLGLGLEFVLAASQHLEELVVNGPQDFWTRISHVLRVVHPLARVDEDEGSDFLKTLFHSQWYGHVKVSDFPDDMREVWAGKLEGKEWKPSPLCDIVERAIRASLVPLVVRDVLSVRGVRSMIAQVFSRVRWARTVKQFEPDKWESKDQVTKELEQMIVEAVNSAVQDVLVVLNESRVTPRRA